MKQLTLIRHAKSSWKDPTLADFDRPLNKRGRSDLEGLAQRTCQRLAQPDLILASGARRARETAEAIAARLSATPLELVPELYESCYQTLLNVLQTQSDHHHHLMLVGHNPGLEELSYYLTHKPLDNFPTGGIVHIHLSIRSWSEVAESCGTLTWFDYPKLHPPYAKS
ncbi:SixA phosphatase family protein [Marinobacterium arenosum]|uniref:SixA phosphatase family protein n=1 Tax=Marinobacterium arenosum TaxID=2862496 RepID=UPI001C97F68D|nr:histidine phosphatase family protein [Marinobacterium arenosum]MBY4675717.1 histidine phosphatase family protein [Marinobacterium arenosum]